MKLSEAYWSRRKSISYFLPIYILYFIRNDFIFCISYRKISSTEIGQLKTLEQKEACLIFHTNIYFIFHIETIHSLYSLWEEFIFCISYRKILYFVFHMGRFYILYFIWEDFIFGILFGNILNFVFHMGTFHILYFIWEDFIFCISYGKILYLVYYLGIF